MRTQLRTWLGVLVAVHVALRGQNVLTWHNDNGRTGQNLHETALTHSNVIAATFGKLFVLPTDGKVDAQPLYVQGVTFLQRGTYNALYVVTEHDSAYAFDADTGAVLWQVSALAQNETASDDRGCSQVSPEIGITSTPVIDLQRGPHGTMYLVAMSKDASGAYHHRLHALDLTTGAEQFGGPVEIRATYPGSGVEGNGSVLTFDAKGHKQRPGLAIVNGVVYTSWGSHCDRGAYTGWLIGYSETTLQQTSVLNVVPNGAEAGIWASGAAPAVDAVGNLYIPTGNGTFDAVLASSGLPTRGDYGNAFLKISTAGSNLTVTDYFTMSNTASESTADLDLGSGGLILLPALNDATGRPRSLVLGGGKDGNIYVVDQNNLGKFNPGANAVYQQLAATPIYSSPAWFDGTLFYGSTGRALKAFSFINGGFSEASGSQSATVFPYPGTTPSVSANGTTDGIVWAAENATTAVLHAYDAADLSKELYNSNQATNGRDHFGEGNKYIVPTVAGGKVFVGTTNGVGVFGLLTPAIPSPVIAAVTNAASSAAGAIAPGEIVTITGRWLGPAAGVGFSLNQVTGMVDTLLAGTRVLFAGLPAPILYTSATQVNAIVPSEVGQLQTRLTMQVENQGVRSAAVPVTVASAAPGVFTSPAGGSGQAAALNQDGSLNSASNPAAPGSYVTLYFTGGGQTTPPGQTGSVTGPGLEYFNQHVSVTVGGLATSVSFAGAAPSYVSGLGQINFRLADNAPAGIAQQVVVTVGEFSSPSTATLAVR